MRHPIKLLLLSLLGVVGGWALKSPAPTIAQTPVTSGGNLCVVPVDRLRLGQRTKPYFEWEWSSSDTRLYYSRNIGFEGATDDAFETLFNFADVTADRTISFPNANVDLSLVPSAIPIPISQGGTGATTAPNARTNLGLAIGVDVQAWDSDLDTWATLTPSAYFQTLINDADAAAVRTTLGLGDLAVLNTVNNDNWSGTDLSVANGGTGASTLTDTSVLVGNGASTPTQITPGTNGQVLAGQTSADPSFVTVGSGAVLQADGDLVPVLPVMFLMGTAGDIIASARPSGDAWVASTAVAMSDGVLRMSSATFYKGMTITHLAFTTGSTGVTGPLNRFYLIYDEDYDLVAQTADQTTTAWPAFTTQKVALTSPYVVATEERFHVGLYINSSGSAGNQENVTWALTTSPWLSGSGNGTFNSGLTTAPPNPAVVGTEDANRIAWVAYGSLP